MVAALRQFIDVDNLKIFDVMKLPEDYRMKREIVDTTFVKVTFSDVRTGYDSQELSWELCTESSEMRTWKLIRSYSSRFDSWTNPVKVDRIRYYLCWKNVSPSFAIWTLTSHFPSLDHVVSNKTHLERHLIVSHDESLERCFCQLVILLKTKKVWFPVISCSLPSSLVIVLSTSSTITGRRVIQLGSVGERSGRSVSGDCRTCPYQRVGQIYYGVSSVW